jgi:hypothetical protein
MYILDEAKADYTEARTALLNNIYIAIKNYDPTLRFIKKMIKPLALDYEQKLIYPQKLLSCIKIMSVNV